jgi:hypothetical protein
MRHFNDSFDAENDDAKRGAYPFKIFESAVETVTKRYLDLDCPLLEE